MHFGVGIHKVCARTRPGRGFGADVMSGGDDGEWNVKGERSAG
jgi:hypothetical protein